MQGTENDRTDVERGDADLDFPDHPPDDLEEARPLEEQTMRLFEVALDLLCVAHPSGYFVRVNPAFERVLGYTAEELTSRPIVEFVHPDDRESTIEALEQLGEAKNLRGFTNRYICKDGSVVWLEWHSRAYNDGELIYASARDITDLRRAERERERMELKFREAQKLESVALLAGGIAHDFNNLLTTILGNAGLISMHLEEGHPVRERAEAIRRAASTAADLCEQLLAYAGEGQFDIDKSNLSAIVRETDHLLEASVSSPAQIEYDLDDDLPPAELDVTQIRQILMNVVKNASEALGDESGTIRIETSTAHFDRADFAETYLNEDLNEGEYVTLTVSDTGCGMSAEEIERIFDPFYTSKFDGRGLGLAATLGIVRAHEGALQVDSAPGEGTTFRFCFPALQTNQPFTDEQDDTPVPSLEMETVLAVDDEEGILEYLKDTLESQKIGVLTASNGTEAVDLFEDYHEEVSAVVLDLTMPGLSSEEVYRELRAVDGDTPIVLSSGYNQSKIGEDLPDPEQTNAEFLQKPFGPEDLLRSLHGAAGH